MKMDKTERIEYLELLIDDLSNKIRLKCIFIDRIKENHKEIYDLSTKLNNSINELNKLTK